MGGNTELTSELAYAMGNLTAAHSALDIFATVARKIEQRSQELEAKEADLNQRETKVVQLEGELAEKQARWTVTGKEMREQSQEWERKKTEWEGIEKKMEANVAKLEHVIQLDVGGQRFSTTKSTLLQNKGSMFESMLVSDHSQRSKNGEIFIDHDPKYFGLIINFLRDGRLRNSDVKTVDLEELEEDFDYFKLQKPALFAQRKVVNPAPALVLDEPRQEIQPQPFKGGNLLSEVLKKKIVEWLPQQQFSLIYKATRDGFEAQDFHGKCDNKGSTITIIQSKDGYLFGGYTSQSWDGKDTYKADPNAFIFSLTNPHSFLPTQYFIKPNKIYLAILCRPSDCACFGSGDIRVLPASHQNNCSYTHFPSAFTNTTGKSKLTFTGACNFSTSEIEVYSLSE